jgi:hypothetical protein
MRFDFYIVYPIIQYFFDMVNKFRLNKEFYRKDIIYEKNKINKQNRAQFYL